MIACGPGRSGAKQASSGSVVEMQRVVDNLRCPAHLGSSRLDDDEIGDAPVSFGSAGVFSQSHTRPVPVLHPVDARCCTRTMSVPHPAGEEQAMNTRTALSGRRFARGTIRPSDLPL